MLRCWPLQQRVWRLRQYGSSGGCQPLLSLIKITPHRLLQRPPLLSLLSQPSNSPPLRPGYQGFVLGISSVFLILQLFLFPASVFGPVHLSTPPNLHPSNYPARSTVGIGHLRPSTLYRLLSRYVALMLLLWSRVWVSLLPPCYIFLSSFVFANIWLLPCLPRRQLRVAKCDR